MEKREMSGRGCRKGRLAFWMLLGLLLAGGASGRAAAEGLVFCRSLQAEGEAVRLELTVGSPAPANVILTLTLPPGTAVQLASPPMSRFDSRSGEAKWLLKDLKSGTLTVKILLSRPVEARTLQGEIRYKHPGTGAMIVEPLVRGS